MRNLNKIKKQSIAMLNEALNAAKEKAEEVSSTDLEALKELTEKHLTLDNNPHRVKLLNEYRKGAKLTGADGIRRKLGAFDLAYFGRAYLSHYFNRPSPEFHKELDKIWEEGVLKGVIPDSARNAKIINRMEGCKKAVAAPRGHAKSTNLTFKDNLHAVLYEYKHYIIIISDTYDQAAGFLQAIKEELEENEAIIEDFGSLVGRLWREDVILTKTKIKVQAKGSGQKMRGLKHKQWRPDLIVLDDIENDELVRTVEQREKLKNWYYKAVSKCGDGYTDFVYIGTMLHYDGMLAKVMNNPDYRSIKYKAVMSFSTSPLWDKWEEIFTDLSNDKRDVDALKFFNDHKEEMLKGTKVLWEDKLSYYDLMKMRISEGEASFNSEEQNEPINPDDCLFNEEWFDYFNPHEMDFAAKNFKFYGFVDPSLGKSKHSDFSAIITMALDTDTGYMYVVDADVERRHPDTIINDVIQKAIWLSKTFEKNYYKFGAETNQFQWFLKEQLAKESARRRVYLPIEEVRQTSDKVMRIQTLQPDIKNKYIKFNKQHKRLLEQLKYFPMADHDDAPDALEGCRSLAASPKKRMIIKKRRGLGI